MIRGRLGDRAPRLFGTVFFGASVLLAPLVFVGTALLAAVVPSVFAPRIATLVMFSTASPCRATGALATWLVRLTAVVVAVGLGNVSIATPTVYVVPAWIALVSIVLLVHHPHRLRIPRPRTPHRPRHAQPRQPPTSPPRPPLTHGSVRRTTNC